MSLSERNSKFEAVKILGILLVILSHVAHNSGVDFYSSTTNSVAASFFVYLGQVGNGMFILPSCYFASEKFNLKKWILLVIETLFYSILFLILFSVFDSDTLSLKDVLKSMLPITFANNWFITAYLLFMLSVPFLNIIISNISKQQYFALVVGFTILYSVVPSILGKRFFYSEIFGFFDMYLIIMYLKKYKIALPISTRMVIIVLCLSLLGLISLIFTINWLGTYISIISGKTFFWQFYNSIPLILINFSIFTLIVRSKPLKNKIINYISGTSLGIYLIHSNYLVIEKKIYHVVLRRIPIFYPYIAKILICTVLIFVISFIIECTRKKYLDTIFNRIADEFIVHFIEPLKIKCTSVFNLDD